MRKAKRDTAYEDGVEQFLAFAYRDIPQDSEILCPCKRCKNRLNLSLDEVKTHLRCDGILQGYTTWVHHGENYERPTDPFVDVPNITGILGMVLQDRYKMIGMVNQIACKNCYGLHLEWLQLCQKGE